MAETITITMPETPNEREEVLRFLSAHGLVAEEQTVKASGEKGKWARVAERLARGPALDEEFRAGMRD